jgi:hypothetical protein
MKGALLLLNGAVPGAVEPQALQETAQGINETISALADLHLARLPVVCDPSVARAGVRYLWNVRLFESDWPSFTGNKSMPSAGVSGAA